MPPQGPAQLTSEHLTSLRLSVPVLLWRIAQTSGLVDQTCFYCGKHLRHLDGLPVGMSGFLANEPKKEAAPTTDGPVDVAEPEPEGKWVCWHPRCEP
jgi:hypothetical protein